MEVRHRYRQAGWATMPPQTLDVNGSISRYCPARAGCPVLAVPPTPLEIEAWHGLHR
jgi:hypothetical protein